MRVFAMLFASLVLGIAFSANLIAGITAFFIFTIVILLMFVKSRRWVLIAFCIGMYLVGFISSSVIVHINNTLPDYKEMRVISAKVSEDSHHDVNGYVTDGIILEDIYYGEECVKGSAVYNTNLGTHTLHIGDRISFNGTLSHKDIILSDIGASRQYIKGIKYLAKGDSIIDIEGGDISFRTKVVLKFKKALFEATDSDNAGFLIGMMFGDTSSLDGNVKVASKRLGIAHLFAVSGLHVSMISGFIIGILAHFKVRRRYHLLVIPFLVFYAYLCGFSVSILRATIMLTIYLVSRALYLRYDMLSSLSLAGTILLLACPLYLFDVSFVMSFTAVLSIALFASSFFKLFTKKSDKWQKAKMLLATNISVNIGMLPIMLYVFGGTSLLAIPVNFILIPLISLIFPIFFALFIFFALCNAPIVVTILCIPFKLIVMISELLASLNFAGIYFGISVGFVPAYMVVMILVSKFVFINNKVKAVPIILAISIVLLSIVSPVIGRGIVGDKVTAKKSYEGYSVMVQDDKNRDILIIMGDITVDSMESAISTANSRGKGMVYMVVAPCASKEDEDLIEYYFRTLGPDFIMTSEVLSLDNVDRVQNSENIKITYDGNVLFRKRDTMSLFVAPSNKDIENGVFDMVIANNKYINEGSTTPKYYINFAKDSQGKIISDFTFYIKNGKISVPNKG